MRPWVAPQNHIRCAQHHLLHVTDWSDTPKGQWTADFRRLAGHAFLRCGTCQPASYMFAVFVGTPDPFVLLYGISEVEFQWWVAAANHESPTTLEMLYRLHDATGQRYNSRYQGD